MLKVEKKEFKLIWSLFIFKKKIIENEFEEEIFCPSDFSHIFFRRWKWKISEMSHWYYQWLYLGKEQINVEIIKKMYTSGKSICVCFVTKKFFYCCYDNKRGNEWKKAKKKKKRRKKREKARHEVSFLSSRSILYHSTRARTEQNDATLSCVLWLASLSFSNLTEWNKWQQYTATTVILLCNREIINLNNNEASLFSLWWEKYCTSRWLSILFHGK